MCPAVWPGVSMTRAFERADAHCVALAHRFVDMGNALRLGARRDHAAFVTRFELADAGGVIAMMMRHQDFGEPPAGLFQRGLDRQRLPAHRSTRSRRLPGRE